jgi:AbiJ N-terminal domain 3
LQTVAALNEVLARDGYELARESELSGHPIFAFHPVVRGVGGRAKNLIFASRGPKPEIGFADAINNDIVILSGEESCLVYDRPITGDGLLWSELVAWWSEVTPGNTAANLGAGLQESLASNAERMLFATYFKAYRSPLGEALPALLPQVYLHYDPAVVRTLRHRLPLPRQRMDFLLLLPVRQRIVLEVDGRHHFSENDNPSLKVYADMVSADRELRLAGYEVYRFGANELVGGRRIADRRFLREAVSPTSRQVLSRKMAALRCRSEAITRRRQRDRRPLHTHTCAAAGCLSTAYAVLTFFWLSGMQAGRQPRRAGSTH